MAHEDAPRKPYDHPQITHELELETRAGSPASLLPDLFDLYSTDSE